jgi:hypothetical protein
MTISRKFPVRGAFSSCSSGNSPGCYYETKGHALRAFDSVLSDYGYMLDPADCSAWSGDVGRATVAVLTVEREVVGSAIFSYYRTESGRWEFIGYLA